MEREKAKTGLKKLLLAEVRRFYSRDNSLWKRPIVETLRDLRIGNVQAVLFGGTLRTLLLSRLADGTPGRPRDVDIVVSGLSIEALKTRFQAIITRETRFGGIQLQRREWQFDVWPLGQTWAFMHDRRTVPAFEALPSTTFFNLEAIAVDVWAPRGHRRRLYSGDDQFFEGVLSRTLEVNREDNPFPALCVVRALVMSADLDFRIGPRLAHYIALHGKDLTSVNMDDLQRKHYGRVRADGETLRVWIDVVAERFGTGEAVTLPISRQLHLWPDSEEQWQVRVHALSK